MSVIRIAVGSARLPKLKAVQSALASFGEFFGAHASFEIRGYEVESGVSHTPLSRNELMQGARQRAEALAAQILQSGEEAAYFVGVEGGLEVALEEDARRVFLQSWAYVSDGRKGHFGCSGSIELPEALAAEVVDKGIELSVAIDAYAGAVGIRDGKGAWGVLSRNLIDRQESFRLAVVAGFAPFYNARVYQAAAAARA